MLEIPFKRLVPNAKPPVKAKPGDAAYDLAVTKFTQDGNVVICDIGIAMAIPEGYEGQVRSRSGLGMKGVFITNGVGTIDSGYRGEIKVLLSTVHGTPFLSNFNKNLKIGKAELTIGDRVAQLAIREVPATNMVEVGELDETQRGDTGFGSSGLQSVPSAQQKEPAA